MTTRLMSCRSQNKGVGLVRSFAIVIALFPSSVRTGIIGVISGVPVHCSVGFLL